MATKPQAKTLARELLQHNHELSQAYGLARRDYLDLVETIIVYKFSQMTREEIRTMLDLPNIDLKDTRFYQDVFAEGELKEREQRRQQDIALIKRLLTQQFETLPTVTERRLDHLSAENARGLIEALFHFNSLKDVQAWLKNHSSPKQNH